MQVKVIPTLSWAEDASFQFCFDGIEPGGTVSVSTIGVKRDKESMEVWKAGMDEAIKRLKPYKDGSAKTPMETMTKGRVYVLVVNKKTGAKLKSITYYDNSLKRSKQIDLDHPHQGENPHTHLGYIHDEYGTRKLTTKEKRLVAFVYRTWDNWIAKHGVG